MTRRTRIVVLKVVVSTALLFYLFGIRKIEVARVAENLEQTDFLWMGGAILTLLLGRVITAWRWQVLLEAQEIRSSFKTLIASLFVANFFNLFLPSTIGGDAVRAYDVGRESRRPGASILTLIIERLIGGFALLVIAMLSLGIVFFLGNAFQQRYPVADLVLPVVFLFILMGFGYGMASSRCAWSGAIALLTRMNLGRISENIRKAGDIWFALKSRSGSFRLSIGLSFALQINVVLYHYVIGRALNLPIPFLYFCLVVPLVFLVLLFPFSINGIGVRESTFLFFFQGVVSPPEAIAFSWLQFFTTLVLGGIGGLVYVVRKGPVSEKSG